jgi:hypothetical protein
VKKAYQKATDGDDELYPFLKVFNLKNINNYNKQSTVSNLYKELQLHETTERRFK